jgi:hypothetical protein
MKNYFTLMTSALVFFAAAGLAGAADTPPVTLKGTLECSKCTLHETAECGNVLAVKDGTTEVKYYLVDNDLSKSGHGSVCMEPKENVSVTGTVEEKDGKKWLTATKIEMPAK